jgi:chemotaxis protein histidine kinase CheA
MAGVRNQAFQVESLADGEDYESVGVAQEISTLARSVGETVGEAEQMASDARSAWERVSSLKTAKYGTVGAADVSTRAGALTTVKAAESSIRGLGRKIAAAEDQIKFAIMRLNKAKQKAKQKAEDDARKQAEAAAADAARAADAAARDAERERQRAALEASRAAEAQASRDAIEGERQRAEAAEAAIASRAAEADTRKIELELRRLEMELKIEQQKLEFDMRRLEREEERANIRDDREAAREDRAYAMDLYERGLGPAPRFAQQQQQQQQQYAQPGTRTIWTPDAGQEFGFSPGMTPQYEDPQFAQPQPQQYQQAPVSAPRPAAAPPPVVRPPAPTAAPGFPGFSFDSSFMAPQGQLFGMGGLVGVKNRSLPKDAKVEDGYKIYGPDSSGRFKVVRPAVTAIEPDGTKTKVRAGSTFYISHSQCCKPGQRIKDKLTEKVFYYSGSGKSAAESKSTTTAEDIQSATNVASSVVDAASDAFSKFFSAYQQAKGEPEPASTPTVYVGGGMPGWVAPLALTAAVVGIGVVIRNRSRA